MTSEDSDEWSPYFDLIFIHCLRDCNLIKLNRHFWRMLMRDRFYSLIDFDCPSKLFEEKLSLYEEFVMTKRKAQLEWYPLDALDFELPEEWLVGRRRED